MPGRPATRRSAMRLVLATTAWLPLWFGGPGERGYATLGSYPMTTGFGALLNGGFEVLTALAFLDADAVAFFVGGVRRLAALAEQQGQVGQVLGAARLGHVIDRLHGVRQPQLASEQAVAV